MRRGKGFMVYAGPQMMVLAILRESARYSHQIAKELEIRSKGKLAFQGGTLFPILRRLENEGLVQSEWDLSDRGRARRIFSLTEKGQAEISTQIENWRNYIASVDDVLQGV